MNGMMVHSCAEKVPTRRSVSLAGLKKSRILRRAARTSWQDQRDHRVRFALARRHVNKQQQFSSSCSDSLSCGTREVGGAPPKRTGSAAGGLAMDASHSERSTSSFMARGAAARNGQCRRREPNVRSTLQCWADTTAAYRALLGSMAAPSLLHLGCRLFLLALDLCRPQKPAGR